MAHLIDKDALVAEIERLLNEPAPSHDSQCKWEDGYWCALYKIEEFIDSLQEEPVSVWHDGNTLPINYEIEDILVVYNQYGREYLHLYWEDGIYSDAQVQLEICRKMGLYKRPSKT